MSYRQLSIEAILARNQVPVLQILWLCLEQCLVRPSWQPRMELRPQTLTACSYSLAATVVTSYNLLPLQEDLISGLKGSRIILYPISVCLCELTMASFWHDSIFFQFISLRLGRGESGIRREEKKSLRKRLLKEPGKDRIFFLLEMRSGDSECRARLSSKLWVFCVHMGQK